MSRHSGKRNLVLCEGKTDEAVLNNIAETAGLPDLLIEDYGGKSKLKRRLNSLRASPDYTSSYLRKVLVTRDADENWSDAWNAAESASKSTFGVRLTEPGEWHPISNGPEIALWIAPGERSDGTIETLCLKAAHESTPDTFDCVNSFIACLHENHSIELHEKERFGIWTLAAQGTALGRKRLDLSDALARIPFNWSSSAFNEIRSLLRATSL